MAPIETLQSLLSRVRERGVIIGGVAASHPNLDKERVRFWVKQFGEALDWPDLWEEIMKLL